MLAKRILRCAMSMAVVGVLAPKAAFPATVQPTYESLLEKARQGDPGLDFTALRMASADRLAEMDAADPELRKAMFEALHDDQWAAVIEIGNQVLEQNYLDIDAHMFVAHAYEKSHQPEKATSHRFMGDGLMKSILASGNGRSPQTAFVVISIDEEYSVLHHYRLAPDHQDLVHAGAHSYDVLTARKGAHETATVFFNIDKVVAIENAQVAGHQARP